MKHFEEFGRSPMTFFDRAGTPDEFSCAIGHIAINFSELEDQLGKGITTILGAHNASGEIVISELSFRSKVHVFASIVRESVRKGTRAFNIGYAPFDEILRELSANCFKAAELRNTIMHSSWRGPYLLNEKAIRTKPSARSKAGFQLSTQEVDSAHLLDIAEFIICVATDVETFMFDVDVDDFERSPMDDGSKSDPSE